MQEEIIQVLLLVLEAEVEDLVIGFSMLLQD
jgi:hypothetical protein